MNLKKLNLKFLKLKCLKSYISNLKLKMNPTIFSESQIINIRDEITDYLVFLLEKFIRMADKNEKKRFTVCDTDEIMDVIGFDKDIIIWCFLGDNPNKKEWGYVSSVFPHLNSVKYILKEIEIPRICIKYNIQNEFTISFKIKKNNVVINLRKLNEDCKFTNLLEKDNEELFFENDSLKQRLKDKERMINHMEKEIDILKSYLMLKN